MSALLTTCGHINDGRIPAYDNTSILLLFTSAREHLSNIDFLDNKTVGFHTNFMLAEHNKLTSPRSNLKLYFASGIKTLT